MTMKTSLRIALSSALGLLVAACTITTGPSDDDEERRPWGNSGGSGGSGGSEDPDAGGDETDGGDGGSGGTEDPDAGGDADVVDQCVASSSAGECELCAFNECEAEVCDCKADSGCAAALAESDYFVCLEAANGDSTATADCDVTFLVEATAYGDDASDRANVLGMCLHGNAEDENKVGCPLECGT